MLRSETFQNSLVYNHIRYDFPETERCGKYLENHHEQSIITILQSPKVLYIKIETCVSNIEQPNGQLTKVVRAQRNLGS